MINMQLVFLLLIIAVAVMSVMQRPVTSNFMDHPRDQRVDDYFEQQMEQWRQMHESFRTRENRKSLQSTLVFLTVLAFLMICFAK
jgi:adenosyl cobinamide kinase/adenosyl cobinamide phosphate guanylyltransferase